MAFRKSGSFHTIFQQDIPFSPLVSPGISVSGIPLFYLVPEICPSPEQARLWVEEGGGGSFWGEKRNVAERGVEAYTPTNFC